MPAAPASAHKLPVLLSIHDVMPETLDAVRGIVELLRARALLPATLLIVPGRDWTERDVRQLDEWRQQGFELAGHGWTHRAAARKNFYHRLHSLLLSRDAAEHLSRPSEAISALIDQCFRWFERHHLPAPELYVPPAWAAGRLQRGQLDQLPFRMYETLSGVYHAGQRRFRRLPVIGFEADTRLREHALRLSNFLNRGAAARLHRPLRIALHPFDFDLRMKKQAGSILDAPLQPVNYTTLFQPRPRGELQTLKDAQ